MSYRPHNSDHDYYDKGIYLITLVVGNRDHLLGELNMDVHNPLRQPLIPRLGRNG